LVVRENLKNPDRLLEGEVLHLHQERDDIPVLLATEAVEGLGIGKDREGRHVILVKAAAGNKGSAGPMEREIVAYDFLDADSFLEAPDVGVDGGTAGLAEALTRQCRMLLDHGQGR